MKSQRTASIPRCMPSASRAGRITMRAVRMKKKREGGREYGGPFPSANLDEALKQGRHVLSTLRKFDRGSLGFLFWE